MTRQPMPARRRYAREHVIESKIAAVGKNIALGRTVAESCKSAQISVPTYYRWLAQKKTVAGPQAVSRESRKQIRDRIVQAAKTLFVEQGFAATLETVSAAAGVARRSVYNQFGSKERLFAEVVQALYLRRVTPALDVTETDDLPTMLTKSARFLLAFVYDPESVALFRVTLGEYRNHPQLAKVAYSLRSARGVPTVVNVVAKRLQAEMALGTIDRIDPHIAAENFVGSFVALPRYRALVGEKAPTETEIEERIAIAVRIFIQGVNYRGDRALPACDHGAEPLSPRPHGRYPDSH